MRCPLNTILPSRPRTERGGSPNCLTRCHSVQLSCRGIQTNSRAAHGNALLLQPLAAEPELLICDEVTSALDVSVQALIVELLRRLQKERRLAMIFITHNLALVRSIAQTAVVFSAGQLVEGGAVAQVLETPQEPYTVKLMQDVPRLAATMSTQDSSSNS